MKLKPLDISINNNLYDLYHNQFKMADGWLPGNQKNNFHSLIKIALLSQYPLKGASCLDVGCGSGDLSIFLRKIGIKDYLGVDIFAKSVENAQKKYPYETFFVADFLDMNFNTKFDFVFCSGALTVKLETVNNYDYLHAMVEKMWILAKVGVAFNVLTDDDPMQDPDLFFYAPSKIKTICKNIAPTGKLTIEKTTGVYQVHVYLSHT